MSHACVPIASKIKALFLSPSWTLELGFRV